jgi:putative redox protein
MLKVSITSKGANYAYKVDARQHSFDIDAETTHKGGDTAINPHEAALGGLGGCTVMTMAMYAAQKGWSVTFELTEVTEDKIDDPADTSEGTKKKIPHIVERITVKGATDEQLAKLKDIGKRCPVYLLMINPKVIDLEVEHAK